ncbi:MAG: transcriptional repressor NrdR [Clostridia bacterium]|nr:transcriptional repressor NrdR [Clostridia bacterium]
MKCRYCSCTESRVVDSRPTEDGTAIRRRRECANCGRRFTTYEKIEEIPILVVKRDGSREAFDSNKILAGVRKACEKRPVSSLEQNKLVDDVSREISNTLEQEVTSIDIGELVMKHLRDLDEVAYVRFASVYRSFKDINTFMQELKSLLGDSEKKAAEAEKQHRLKQTEDAKL